MFRSGTAVGRCGLLMGHLGGRRRQALRRAPEAKLRTVGSPPSTAAPGASFTLRGQLVNTSRSTQRPTSTSRCARRRRRRDQARDQDAASREGRPHAPVLRHGELPAGLAEGTYYVRTCASGACRFSSMRADGTQAREPPAPQPNRAVPAATPGATATPTAGDRVSCRSWTSRPRPARVRRARVHATGGGTRPSPRSATSARAGGFGVTETDDASRSPRPTSSAIRAVVFLNTAGDVAQRRAAGRVPELLHRGRRLPRRRRRRSRPSRAGSS